jgi:hypothetical protein
MGSHRFVKVDGELIPVEDVPLETVSTLEGDLGKTGEESFGNSLAPELRANEEVFEVNSGVPAPGGVEGDVESHCGGTSHTVLRPFRDEALKDWPRTEAVAEQVFGSGDGGLGLALVLSQFADEGEHLRNVRGNRFSDMERGAHGLDFWVASHLLKGMEKAKSSLPSAVRIILT